MIEPTLSPEGSDPSSWRRRWSIEKSDRLDRFLSEYLPVSRRVLRAWIEQGRVHVNGKKAAKGKHLATGDQVEISLPGDPAHPLLAELPPPPTLAQSEDWIAMDKPAGLPSHPKMPFETGTALTRLLAIDPNIATAGDDTLQGGLAHRLDPGTSGVLIAARNPEAWERLRRQFSSGRVEKLYLARVRLQPGKPVPLDIEQPLAPCRGDDTRVAWKPSEMSSTPRSVRTECRTLDDRWLVIRIRTGHRHQIRAHLASIGHAIDGDEVYGGALASRLFLHAWALQLPSHGWIVSPPPESWNIPVTLEPRLALNRFRRRPVRSPGRSSGSTGPSRDGSKDRRRAGGARDAGPGRGSNAGRGTAKPRRKHPNRRGDGPSGPGSSANRGPVGK